MWRGLLAAFPGLGAWDPRLLLQSRVVSGDSFFWEGGEPVMDVPCGDGPPPSLGLCASLGLKVWLLPTPLPQVLWSQP